MKRWAAFALLVVWVIMAYAVPSLAAKSISNGIEVTLYYGEWAIGEISDYLSTLYAVQLDDRYLIAEYDASNNSYMVTDFTDDKDLATHFQFGKDISAPERLVITGLESGEYVFHPIMTVVGYSRCSFAVSFTPDGVLVNGDASDEQYIEAPVDRRINVTIQLAKAMDLPVSEPPLFGYEIQLLLCLTCLGSFIALIVTLIRWKIQKKRGSEKEHENG